MVLLLSLVFSIFTWCNRTEIVEANLYVFIFKFLSDDSLGPAFEVERLLPCLGVTGRQLCAYVVESTTHSPRSEQDFPLFLSDCDDICLRIPGGCH